MVSVFVVILVAIYAGLKYGRPRRGFLPDFAKLLDRPEFVDAFSSWLIGRSFLKGQFRDRKVMILQQKGTESHSSMVVVSMETHLAATIESYEFSGSRTDREGELALFALEVTHKLRLRHEDRCLKAMWSPFTFSLFPARFDPSKWQSVLEAMHAVAGSLERRAANLAGDMARARALELGNGREIDEPSLPLEKSGLARRDTSASGKAAHE